MSDGKNIFDVVDKMVTDQLGENQDARTLRAAALSPVIGQSLQSAVSAYEKSADSTEIAQHRTEAPMKPGHAEFIMKVREEAVLDVLFLHKKHHGRTG